MSKRSLRFLTNNDMIRRMQWRMTAIGAVLGIALAWGCDPLAPREGQSENLSNGPQDKARGIVVAEWKDHRMTAGELVDDLAGQEPYIQLRFSSNERKKQYLRQLINISLLADLGMEDGLIDHPTVTRQMRTALAREEKQHIEQAKSSSPAQQNDQQNDEATERHLAELRRKAKFSVDEQKLAAVVKRIEKPQEPEKAPSP